MERADMDKLVTNCGGFAPSAFAIWAVLCGESNDRKSKTFNISAAFIGHRSGVSRKTVFRMLDVLVSLGMVERHQNRSQGGEHPYDCSTYTIIPQCRKVSPPQGHKVPPPRDREFKLSDPKVEEVRRGAPPKAHTHSYYTKKKAPSNPAPPQRLPAGGAGAGASEPDPKSRHQIGGAW